MLSLCVWSSGWLSLCAPASVWVRDQRRLATFNKALSSLLAKTSAVSSGPKKNKPLYFWSNALLTCHSNRVQLNNSKPCIMRNFQLWVDLSSRLCSIREQIAWERGHGFKRVLSFHWTQLISCPQLASKRTDSGQARVTPLEGTALFNVLQLWRWLVDATDRS